MKVADVRSILGADGIDEFYARVETVKPEFSILIDEWCDFFVEGFADTQDTTRLEARAVEERLDRQLFEKPSLFVDGSANLERKVEKASLVAHIRRRNSGASSNRRYGMRRVRIGGWRVSHADSCALR